jgi:hypothetical protein
VIADLGLLATPTQFIAEGMIMLAISLMEKHAAVLGEMEDFYA